MPAIIAVARVLEKPSANAVNSVPVFLVDWKERKEKGSGKRMKKFERLCLSECDQRNGDGLELALLLR